MAHKKSIFRALFGGSRRKSKGFFGALLEGQRRTEKYNTPGSKRKYKSEF